MNDNFSKDRGKESSEGLELRLNTDNASYTVIGIGDCTEQDIIIDTHDGLPITAIADNAFETRKLSSVTIGDNVCLIGERAFANCMELRCVSVGSGILKIGAGAFYYCEGISSVYIYDLISWCNIKFGDYMANPIYYADKWFLNDSPITELTLPEQITEIHGYAFAGSKKLKSVSISKNVKTISEYAFYMCSELQNITLCAGVTNIERFAFYKCDKIETLTLPNTIRKIGEHSFNSCSKIKSLIIPEGVIELGNGSFAGCKGLREVSVPESLELFGSFVFQGCDMLIYHEANTAKYIGNEKNPFVVLAGIKDKTVRKFDINTKTKFIADKVFSHAENLKAITIPRSVIGIGELSFHACSSLKKVSIKGKLRTIGRAAFERCESLNSFEIPDSVRDIKESYHIFKDCSSLEKVKIGNGMTELPVGIFEGCKILDTVELGAGIKSFRCRDFKGSRELRNVKIKNPDAWWFVSGESHFEGKGIKKYDKIKPSFVAELISTYPMGHFYTDDSLNDSLSDFRIN